MSALREAAQQALEALEYAQQDRECPSTTRQAIAALAQQAEPVQEPAFHGFMSDDGTQVDVCFSPSAPRRDGTYATAYYTAPPHRVAQQAEPVARECSDPMCACRGGPCAECEEGEREKEIEDLRSSLYFYQRRCEALQSWQSKMRDPERTIVCDILANGKTLDPAFAGDRYTAPPQQAEPGAKMTAHRAVYFMERFKREEKMLGPNEQAALDFVISILEQQDEPRNQCGETCERAVWEKNHG